MFPSPLRRPSSAAVISPAPALPGLVLLVVLLILASILLLAPTRAAADGGVTFVDLVPDPDSGLVYRRAPSASNQKFDAIKANPPYDATQRLETPIKARGAPGVALFDHDGDGDIDVFVTNGPGAANGLFSNQLRETGEPTFVDRAAAAGVATVDLDATGACFGDLDNDGDPDLVILSQVEPNRLFENLGDGTFRDVSVASGLADGPVRRATGCSLGDVDGDGLLDLAVGNAYDDWTTFHGILADPFAFNDPNELWLNRGGLRFEDVSAASGILDQRFADPVLDGEPGLTWALALVDLDQDGDLDLLTADDQGGIPPADRGGVDRGLLHFLANDGTGRFEDVSAAAGTDRWGSWMGLTFGDYDCDGHLDFFATNFGDYTPVTVQEPGRQPSRWLLGRGDGTFDDPGVGDLLTTPFGWGASTADYDNDGDQDVIFHGGHDVGPGIEAGNPGVILANPGCSAAFQPDFDALAGSTDHSRRTVHGMAVGDLDENGFLDIVSVSNLDIPEDIPLAPHAPIGSPFDPTAFFVLTFEPDAGGVLAWNGNEYANGTLAVELNRGENGHRSLFVDTVGTRGLTPGGRSNRDGIGAVVTVRSVDGRTTLRPIVGGASYASQDALEAHFGLGAEDKAAWVEVLWPGGVRNRLYDVRADERVVFPEIPCSFDDAERTLRQYLLCLTVSLDGLRDAGVLTDYQRVRFLLSALRARSITVGTASQCRVAGLGADLGGAVTEESLEQLLGGLEP